MTLHRSLVPVALLVVGAVASPARSQESGDTPSEPVVIPATRGQGPTGQGSGDGTPPETTDRWVAFTKEFTKRIDADGRSLDTVEECVAWVELDPRDLEPVRTGALRALELGTAPGATLTKGDGFYDVAERLLLYGVARGGAGDEEGIRKPDAVMAYVIGRLRFADKQWETAYQMLKVAYDGGFDPDRVREWYFRATVNRGVALVDESKPFKATRTMLAVMKEHADAPGVTPRDITYAKLMMAAAYRDRDERPEAERLLREVVDANQGDSRIHMLLGRIYVDQGRVEDGLEQYRRAMQINTDRRYVEPLMETASALLKLSPPRGDEALEMIQAYRRVEPDEPTGLFVLAQVQEARGEYAEARSLYRRVVRMRPDATEMLLKLLHVLSLTGDPGDEKEANDVRRRINELAAAREKRDREKMQQQDGTGMQPADTDRTPPKDTDSDE